jgi:hypothetical protein
VRTSHTQNYSDCHFILFLLLSSVYAQTDSDFKTEIVNGTITITGYTGNSKDVKIPEVINGIMIVSIGDHAFSNNQLDECKPQSHSALIFAS